MTTDPTGDDAIHAALAQDWENAVKINTTLTKKSDKDIDSLNRLGFAYFKLGQLEKAKRCYTKVLSIDRYNQIALKNMKRLTSGKKVAAAIGAEGRLSPLMFLEDPGKTKIVSCVNPAPSRVLSVVSCGQEVFLKVKKHTVEVRDSNDAYLGALPDDVSFKLIKYTAAGNRYLAVVKSAGSTTLTVFIRELSRGKRFFNQPSFVSSTSYIPFSRSDGQKDREKLDVLPTGEDDSEEPENDDEG
ncbi:MAG: tetratricopeptide repeat protein [bacterium]|nr:tetratricopeptide repeat protein [bacterium]